LVANTNMRYHPLVWRFEGRAITVSMAHGEHEYMDYGLVHGEFVDVNSAEMYGILRSRNVEGVWLAPEEPIRICLDVTAEGIPFQEWYTIDSEDYVRFLYDYINIRRPTFPKLKTVDWKKEGF